MGRASTDDPGRRISARLANGAEHLVIGEITANTGLIVSQAPRNNPNFDIIVNSPDLSRGCRVEVKHSRTGFKANISGDEYDFLVFVYAPTAITDGRLEPTAKRKIFVFPKDIVESTPRGKKGTNFNPKYVSNYGDYKDAYHLIAGALE
jgi:hypothetical protein